MRVDPLYERYKLQQHICVDILITPRAHAQQGVKQSVLSVVATKITSSGHVASEQIVGAINRGKKVRFKS